MPKNEIPDPAKFQQEKIFEIESYGNYEIANNFQFPDIEFFYKIYDTEKFLNEIKLFH